MAQPVISRDALLVSVNGVKEDAEIDRFEDVDLIGQVRSMIVDHSVPLA